MEENMFRKYLLIGVFILLLGAYVIPSIGIYIEEEKNINSPFENINSVESPFLMSSGDIRFSWYATISVVESGSAGETLTIGESDIATDGFDSPPVDIEHAPYPPSPYLVIYSLVDSKKLIKDTKYGPSCSKIWDVYVYWVDTVATSVNMSWSVGSIPLTEYSYVFLKNMDSGSMWDMKSQSSIVFSLNSGSYAHFNVLCDNIKPDAPSTPSGNSNPVPGVSYDYSSSTADPEGDQLYYWWDWGDGTNSSWVGPYNSGVVCNQSHIWGCGGSQPFSVKVKARDDCDQESNWSGVLQVTPQCPVLSYSPMSYSFGWLCEGVTDYTSFEIWNSDGGILNYSFSESCSWITSVSPMNGSSSGEHDTITVSIDTSGVSSGSNSCDVQIISNVGNGTFSVSVVVNSPPNTPSSPSPVNGTVNVAVGVVLSWSGGDPDSGLGDSASYDVYFEAGDSTPDVLVSDDQPSTSWNPPGDLNLSTIYYWQIVSMDECGETATGPIWHFTTAEKPLPDLDCSGSLRWTDVYAGSTVVGSFKVENIGDTGSLLNWEVDSYPSWGIWTFTPDSGSGLAAGGSITVTVSVVVPSQTNTKFTGKVKIKNSDNPTDFCEIDAYLETPRVKNINSFNLVRWIIQKYLEILLILRYILV